jgi:transposase
LIGMSRFRLQPTPAQEQVLLEHCGHARFVWNLAVEQHAHWQPGRRAAPGFGEQCRQLTQARAEKPWLAAGSVRVQQQALRDFAQAMANFFRRTHRRPTWRRRGRAEGVVVSAALSTGELLNAPALRGTEKARLLRLQRKLSRAQRGSTRRGKVKTAGTEYSIRGNACRGCTGRPAVGWAREP